MAPTSRANNMDLVFLCIGALWLVVLPLEEKEAHLLNYDISSQA